MNKNLPDYCFIWNPYEEKVVKIFKGENGYRLTDLSRKDWKGLNEIKGIEPAQVGAMIAGSMFGWDTQFANPNDESYRCFTWRDVEELLEPITEV